jgi:hypothetical protein
LTALVVILSAIVWADNVEKAMRARVVLTTDPKAVESCALVGTVSDDSLSDLRKKTVRAGADTGLLSFTSGDEVVARIFRCPSPQSIAPVATAVAPPTPPASGLS